MTAVSSGRYKVAILLFILILLIFLVVTDLFLMSRLRSQTFNEEYNHSLSEINLVGLFIREPLLSKNYDEVEQFVTQWREEHDGVIDVEAILPNGFKLVEASAADYGTNNYYEIQKHIQYLGKDLMYVRVVKEYMHARIVRRLQIQLIIISFIVTGFFGCILWFTVQKYALVPLEKSKNDLETVVRERTKIWEEASSNLLSEIDIRKKTQTELKAKLKELEEFYDMAVGREMKLKTLKDEIAKLKKEVKKRAAV